MQAFLYGINLEKFGFCGGVSVVTFDFLLATLAFSSDAYKNSILTTYLLTPGTCYLGDGTAVPVYYFDAGLWGEFDVFTLSVEFTCPDPCKYTSGHFVLP